MKKKPKSKPRKRIDLGEMVNSDVEIAHDIPGFDDVTFLVWNINDREKAIKRAREFIAAIKEATS